MDAAATIFAGGEPNDEVVIVYVLEAENLTKIYRIAGPNSGGTPVLICALDNVSFQVEAGTFLAIMGASGSGKSTLLHVLGGLDTPTSGLVKIDGQNLYEMSDSQLAKFRLRKVGFIFQFFNLLPTLTARENVAVPLILAGQNPHAHHKKIDAVLERVGLAHRAHHKPDQLSGGEQQRVAIARALIMDPAIILADEPTGNLDSANSRALYDLLARLRSEFGRTVVLATHDALGASFAQRVLFLKDGRIVGEMETRGKADATSVAVRYQEFVGA